MTNIFHRIITSAISNLALEVFLCVQCVFFFWVKGVGEVVDIYRNRIRDIRKNVPFVIKKDKMYLFSYGYMISDCWNMRMLEHFNNLELMAQSCQQPHISINDIIYA